MKKTLSIILAVGVILGAAGYFLVKESYAATPADPLFAIQEIADDVERTLTFDEVAKVELEQKILVRRQEQVERMLEREDITEEQLEEALQLMVLQRTRTQEKLQVTEKKQESEKATEKIQSVQQQYDENLDRQIETMEKAQERYSGVGQDVKEETEKEAAIKEKSIPTDIEKNQEDEPENKSKNTENRKQ